MNGNGDGQVKLSQQRNESIYERTETTKRSELSERQIITMLTDSFARGIDLYWRTRASSLFILGVVYCVAVAFFSSTNK